MFLLSFRVQNNNTESSSNSLYKLNYPSILLSTNYLKYLTNTYITISKKIYPLWPLFEHFSKSYYWSVNHFVLTACTANVKTNTKFESAYFEKSLPNPPPKRKLKNQITFHLMTTTMYIQHSSRSSLGVVIQHTIS